MIVLFSSGFMPAMPSGRRPADRVILSVRRERYLDNWRVIAHPRAAAATTMQVTTGGAVCFG